MPEKYTEYSIFATDKAQTKGFVCVYHGINRADAAEMLLTYALQGEEVAAQSARIGRAAGEGDIIKSHTPPEILKDLA